ncbi:uncharacterized protein N7482_008886 [Penicillium canariense]|uniref:Uncharacterized protein n=1 Tax=Penicillium canariense TaxID=189055 RepID=A0A9W9HUM0_9EURO|nr:uncharacterized protein N7482_008886 [Penicillium canariense]KAJ5157786.1 hypothetical protein N7482_008886 [Penicillium canariense]
MVTDQGQAAQIDLEHEAPETNPGTRFDTSPMDLDNSTSAPWQYKQRRTTRSMGTAQTSHQQHWRSLHTG